MQAKTKIGIIGFGRFGTLVASILVRDFSVAVYHYQKKAENISKAKKIGVALVNSLEGIAENEIIILAVPINVTERIIQQIAPLLSAGTLVIDTCSVKTLPCQWLKKHLPKNVEILGTHPMFGPVTSKFNLEKQTFELAGLQIVLCPLRLSEKRLNVIRQFLQRLKLKVIETTPEDHDQQNAKTLALVHFLGRALVASDVREQEIFTPGYSDLLKIIPHTASDNWQLFFDMNNFNVFASKIRQTFLQNCDELDFKIAASHGTDELETSRNVIDAIDGKIFHLLKKRFEVVEKIGKLKQKTQKVIRDEKREAEIIKQKIEKLKLDPDLVKEIYQAIFNYSYKVQKNDPLQKNSKN